MRTLYKNATNLVELPKILLCLLSNDGVNTVNGLPNNTAVMEKKNSCITGNNI